MQKRQQDTIYYIHISNERDRCWRISSHPVAVPSLAYKKEPVMGSFLYGVINPTFIANTGGFRLILRK